MAKRLAQKPSRKPHSRDKNLGLAFIDFVRNPEVEDFIDYLNGLPLIPKIKVIDADTTIRLENDSGLYFPIVYLGEEYEKKLKQWVCDKKGLYGHRDGKYYVIPVWTGVKKICTELDGHVYEKLAKMSLGKKRSMKEVLQELIMKG